MRRIAHLSDLHFGHLRPETLGPLREAVEAARPDLVAISGDLTQRARRRQFQEAAQFLETLPSPRIVVPGNHDVPLFNVLDRFLRPLHNYSRFITADLAPYYEDEEIAVVGINTARSLTFKGGRVNAFQLASIRERLCRLPDGVTKMVVTHHPFDVPEAGHHTEVVGRADMAMKVLAECGADVLLAGHLHTSHIGHTATRYKIEGHSALVIQAGTATSTRERGERNSFNLVEIDHPAIAVVRYVWEEGGLYLPAAREEFRYTAAGWVRESPKEPVEKDRAAGGTAAS
ncbi:MAG: metallophosphoesterase [Thermoanaerobaculia bacterium]